MPKLYFHYGAMNSGKTMELLRAEHQYAQNGQRTLVIKPQADTKGEAKITSRIGIEREVDLLVPPEMDLSLEVSALHKQGRIACLFADEAQFFTPEQIEQLFMLTLDPTRIPVMAYGLRGDFQTHGFPGSTRLLELAHVIKEIRTVCGCGSNATLNARTVNGEYTQSGKQVAIDGSDDAGKIAYVSLCGACYTQKVGPIN